ncbi:MarR family transcriptional regulator [Pelagibius litoralis]|uniref:MarR family transcriptional regulator n=1 Tax=Pelagibius litoralis TaxID=374515 RepID=A0A967EW13_9PROT|nr:MarR family transcriptional regulator [Pelagibius litoralis]NIA68959.1 MarR family transcriptional regulator [Pelagibius litoralis]
MFFLKDLPTQDMLRGYQARFTEMDAPTVEAALKLLRRASLLLRALETYFAEHGLSQTRFLILVLLDRDPTVDGLSATEISEKLDISKPIVTNTLKALAREGFIRVTDNEEDRRARWITLTRKGRARLQALLPGYFETIQTFMAED